MFEGIGGLVLVFLACVAGGVGVWYFLIRPFAVPLEKKIPTGRSYRAGVAPSRARRA